MEAEEVTRAAARTAADDPEPPVGGAAAAFCNHSGSGGGGSGGGGGHHRSRGRSGMACSANHSKGSGSGLGHGLIVGQPAWLEKNTLEAAAPGRPPGDRRNFEIATGTVSVRRWTDAHTTPPHIGQSCHQ